MSDEKWQRVAEDSPERCEAVTSTRGQCLNRQVEGSKFCPAHGGNRAGAKHAKERVRLFHLEKWQQRVNELEDNPALKTLTAELSIVRMMIEQKLKMCKDDLDLQRHSQGLVQLLGQAERLAVAANKLDIQNGQMLDTNQAIAWAKVIIDIIAPYLQSEEDLTEVSEQILKSFQEIKSGVSDQPLG